MNLNSSATKAGPPVHYFDQLQQVSVPTQYAPSLYGPYVAYPSASSYMNNQQSIQPTQQYDSAFPQVLTDYASNQYFQPQYSPAIPSSSQNKMPSSMKWNNKKKTPYSKPSSSGMFYCEICKISCAGEQTYKEHCDGQKHKKKELNLHNTPPNSSGNQKSVFFCQVCQVNCSGSESFNAHLNGKSHIKVCNLQVKLGKEVPADLIAPIMKSSNTFNQIVNTTLSTNNENTIKVIGTPAINFVKGGSLKTMTNDSDAVIEQPKENNIKTENLNVSQIENLEDSDISKAETVEQSSVLDNSQISANQSKNSIDESTDNQIPLLGNPNENLMLQTVDSISNAEPVGLEYISDYTKPNSKAIYYSCSLCNCDFNEVIAKEQHIRGKRHRKNYNSLNKLKNKSIRSSANKTSLNHIGKTTPPTITKKAILKGKPPSINQLYENISTGKIQNQYLDYSISTNNTFDDSNLSLQTSVKDANDSFEINMDVPLIPYYRSTFRPKDNLYLLKKHSEIVPREDELKQYYKHIGNVEKLLKQISDDFLQNEDAMKDILDDSSIENNVRVFQGEIRVGLFGKKLLLRDENQIDLILFCSIKPTISLMKKLFEALTIKLNSCEGEKYELIENVDEAAIDIKVSNGPFIRVTLTSLLIRDLNMQNSNQKDELKDPEQMLDRQKCLDALTTLRRFKWYQAKIAPFNPCPMIVRLLRDLTKRVDAWKPLTCWSLELICERVMSNCLNRPTPIEAFKLILQTLASNVLIKDHNEQILIPDPCEVEEIDSLGYLTEKERVEITESAQTMVQLIAFNKIHQVLDTTLIQEKVNDENNESKNDEDKNDKSLPEKEQTEVKDG